MLDMAVLEVKHLTLDLSLPEGRFRIVDDITFKIELGETVCLVGESGSGKSLVASSLARLVPTPPLNYVGGEIIIEGQDLLGMSKVRLREVRGRVISYIFQEPGAFLNPVLQIRRQIMEVLLLHRSGFATESEMTRLLERVGFSKLAIRANEYPHQLSGGMQQRAMIAMALAPQPKLLIADEPTTALDATVQAQILNLLLNLKKDLQMSLLFITHNFGVVAEISDRVIVMYAGQIVEEAPTNDLLNRPMHPYTVALLDSVPSLGQRIDRLKGISGQVPRPGSYPSGCRFHPRCPKAVAACSSTNPELVEVEVNRKVRCPYWNSE